MVQMLREFSDEAAERGLPISYSSGLSAPSFYTQPSEDSRSHSETYSPIARLGQSEILIIERIAALLSEQARRS